MAKSRKEKIASYDERIAQLENQRKQEIQKMKAEERKARTKRLCCRHGLLGKIMPDLIVITDEQFEEFIKRGINTSYGQKLLAEIMAKEAESGTPNAPTGAGQSTEPTTAKPAETAAQSTPATNTQPETAAAKPNGTTGAKTAESAAQPNSKQNGKPSHQTQGNANSTNQQHSNGTRQGG